jgi:hypothetical protein
MCGATLFCWGMNASIDENSDRALLAKCQVAVFSIQSRMCCIPMFLISECVAMFWFLIWFCASNFLVSDFIGGKRPVPD